MDFAPYAASKAAVLSLTWSSAIRLAQHQIRVNALCPAAVDTEFWQRIEDIKQEQGAEPGARALREPRLFRSDASLILARLPRRLCTCVPMMRRS